MNTDVTLPDGRRYRLRGGVAYEVPSTAPRSRIAFAAAHVVADPTAENVPGARAVLDWDATLAFRRHIWKLGLGVAEAMDTSQRGMGLDYPAVRELVRRSAAEARAVRGRIIAGVGTDQLPPGPATLCQIADAYSEQLDDVLAAGVTPVILCSRAMAATASGPEDYLAVYGKLIDQSDGGVLLHWLGTQFDPALGGDWGASHVEGQRHTLLTPGKGPAAQIH